MKRFLALFTMVLFAALFSTNAHAVLVGVDFGPTTNPTPTNWNKADGKSNLTNLQDENGGATTIGLEFVGDPDPFNAGVNAATIPSHTNSLANIGYNIYEYGAAAQLEFKFTGLQAGTYYQVYVFGLRDGSSGVKQVVSIQGQGTATTFNQEAGTKDLVVNGVEGSSASNLLAYAKIIAASAGGEITITVTSDGALYAVAGVAIDDTLAVGTPSSYEVTVTKVEMYNGTSWVEIFTGTGLLDLAAGGTFPGIENLTLPEGTYSQVRVTFENQLIVEGTANYATDDYYTTEAPFSGQTNLASDPTTVPASAAAFMFLSPGGTQTFAITPITVNAATDYQPILRFTISNTLLLKGTAGTPATYYFTIGAPTVSFVQP